LNTPNIWSKAALDKNSNKLDQIDKSDDILKLGLIILICAIGSIDLLE